MKLPITILALGAAVTLSAQAPDTVKELSEGFASPPRSSGVYVWWHWMDGNITRDGIRKDLEWMHDAGITGIHQFDAGGRPIRPIVPRVAYMSQEWKGDFRYAISMADSLGMEISVASAPGWSNTGGPWVTPEDAIKKLVWSTIETDGGKVNVQLPAAPNQVGQYQDITRTEDFAPWGRDVAVVAVKLPADELDLSRGFVSCSAGSFSAEQLSNGSFSDSAPLNGEPETGGAWIEWSFPVPVTVRALTVGQESSRRGTRANPAEIRWTLQAGDDGAVYKDICGIPEGEIAAMTLDIPATTARRFRIASRVEGERKVSEFHLFSTGRINHSEEKAGFSAPHDFALFPTPRGLEPVSDALVLTGSMDADGLLTCNLPEGRWRIYRFGESLTGKTNHPASPDATGLEVDKLNPVAWERYFKNYLAMYREAAGGLMGQKGITHILVDSYEAGQQTWTPDMMAEFKTRRGYPLERWLPVLAGEIIDGPEQSERFLWDWRATLGELLSENYGRIRDLVSRYGGMQGCYLESQENGRTFVGDGMQVKKNSTVPQSAIWVQDSPSGSKLAMSMADIRESASVAHIWGQNIAAAESFTANGQEGRAYTYCPENLKFVADVAMSCGLNRFVIHDSAHQPSDSAVPGAGLFNYGQWFNRHETWAPFAGAWTGYLSRSCNVLQAGKFVADVLFYYGEDNCITGLYGHQLPYIPDGYAWDFVNKDGLLTAVSAADGRLVTDSGMCYSVLVLGDNCRKMSVPVLRRLVAFAEAGVQVCGMVPEDPAGLSDDPAVFDSLKARLLSVMRTSPSSEVIAEIEPDFSSTSAGMEYVHRTLADGADIYWVRNFSGGKGPVEMSFRTSNRKGFVMRPETGAKEGIHVSSVGERAHVVLNMLPEDAVFVVLHSGDAEYAPAEALEGKKILEVAGPWKVAFQEGRGAPSNAEFEKLCSLTEDPDPGIKYFSGVATYSTEFILSGRDLKKVRALDLGVVKNVAEVLVNGKSIGVVWRTPFVVSGPEFQGALRKGRNTIEVRVANLWRNRIIGDLQPGATRITYTPQDFYTADSELLPSGLIGPVVVAY